MENIQNKALTEVVAFLERSGEDKNIFTAKIQVFENIMTAELDTDDVKLTNEVSVVLLAKTPQGLQVAYNNVISYTADLTEEEIFKKIEDAFPTKEMIDEARAKAEEEAVAKAKFQEEMQNLDPQELAKLAAQQNLIPETAEVVTEDAAKQDEEPSEQK